MPRKGSHPIDRAMVRDFAIAFIAFAGLSLILLGNGDGRDTGTARAAALRPPVHLAQSGHVAQSGHAARLSPATASDFDRTYGQSYDYPVARRAAFDRPPTVALILLLAVLFAGFVTFNLSVVRHLRCVNASPRRRTWRGG